MKRTLTCKLTVSALITSLIAGCSTSYLEPMEDEFDRHYAAQRKNLDQIHEDPGNIAASPYVRYVPDLWLPTVKSTEVAGKDFGNQVTSRHISINRSFSSLQSVAERITLLTGIPVHIAQDPTQKKSSAKNTTATTSTPGLPGLPSFSRNDPAQASVSIMYDGPLSGFLDTVASRYGVSWEWGKGGIHFYKFATRTFRIAALPGDTSSKNTVTNSTGSSDDNTTSGTSTNNDENSSSTGGSVTETDVSINKMSVWTALEKAIKSMLSPSGSVVVTPATGTVTVTDTPQILDRVGTYIKEQNKSLNKRVHLSVRVVSVELNDSEQYGIDWDLLYESIGGHFGAGLFSSSLASEDATSLTFKVLPGKNGSAWAGSNVILSALSGQGKVSNLTSATLTTLNNQPAPIQVGRQIAYLKNSSTTLTDGSSVSNSLNPGTLNTGFSMTVLPHVLDDDELVLQFSVNISSLVSMTQVVSGNSMIQTPEVDTRNFLQRVKIGNGDTLILTGFEQSITGIDSRGVGSPRNPLFGGGVDGSKSNSIIVILVQTAIGD